MRRGFDELEKPTSRIAQGNDGFGQRVLSKDELACIIPKLGRRGHDAAARFMLWSGCRLDEACGATWSEIDVLSGTWTIPASRRKDTRSKVRKKQIQQHDQIILLPRQAVELLRHIGVGEPDALILRGDHGAKLQNWDRWSKAVTSTTGVDGWDRHALRRTTATIAGELGAPPHVISALLGHRNIGDQLTAGYSKARYAAEVGAISQNLSWLHTDVRRQSPPSNWCIAGNDAMRQSQPTKLIQMGLASAESLRGRLPQKCPVAEPNITSGLSPPSCPAEYN